MKIKFFIGILVATICLLFFLENKTKRENDSYALEKCKTSNNKFAKLSSANLDAIDHSNCQCMISSINSDRKFFDSFIHRKKKTIKHHYLKCSKDRYIVVMKETITKAGKEAGLSLNQNNLLSSCFSEKMYEYDINDSMDDFDSKERDEAEDNILNSCLNLLRRAK